MQAHKVTCPSCAAVLKSAAPLQAGRLIKCPQCGVNFQVSSPEVQAAPPRPAARPTPAPARRPARPVEDVEDGLPTRRKPAKPSKSGLYLLIWSLIGGGFVLCLAVGALLYIGYTFWRAETGPGPVGGQPMFSPNPA